MKAPGNEVTSPGSHEYLAESGFVHESLDSSLIKHASCQQQLPEVLCLFLLCINLISTADPESLPKGLSLLKLSFIFNLALRLWVAQVGDKKEILAVSVRAILRGAGTLRRRPSAPCSFFWSHITSWHTWPSANHQHLSSFPKDFL